MVAIILGGLILGFIVAFLISSKFTKMYRVFYLLSAIFTIFAIIFVSYEYYSHGTSNLYILIVGPLVHFIMGFLLFKIGKQFKNRDNHLEPQ